MKDMFVYDPLLFKCPKGSVKKDTKVVFSVKTNYFDEKQENSTKITEKTEKFAENFSIFLCLKFDGEEFYHEELLKQAENGFFETSHTFLYAGHFFYHFKVVFDDKTLFLCKTDDNFSYLSENQGEDFFQLVTAEDYECSNSMQGGLIYQIFVDRFCKVGENQSRNPLVVRDDWGGAIHKNTTDPVKINLEVFGGNFKGVISKLDYLSDMGVTTIYFNPICMANSNHKYDTADYSKVDSMFGTEEIFKKLIFEANKRNIKVVIDGVYNHTGSDSIYFNKLNNFDSVGAYNSRESKYYSWYDFENYPDKYRSWWGIDTLPAIKEKSPEFENYIAGNGGIIEKYLKLGVFGVRLDVVDEIKDDFVKKIEQKVHENNKNFVVMGEVWEDAATKISYDERRKYFSNNELNSVMNYPIKEAILNFVREKNAKSLVSTIRMLQNNYPKPVQDNLMNFLGTHDTNRIFSELKTITNGDENQAKKLLKICFVLLFTMSGVPSIFYGDEYGMENNDGSSRGCFDWENNENDIFYWVKSLTKIRKMKVLKNGDLDILFSSSGKFVYERKSASQRIVVGLNVRPSSLEFELSGKFKNFFTNKIQNNFVLNENEFVILIDEK
jgi:glycosidase